MIAPIVLDASALLCLVFHEPGADAVAKRLDRAVIGAVNYSEALAKIVDLGADADRVRSIIERMKLTVIPFDQIQAEVAGDLRATTRKAGLSLGDRACLALAMTLNGSTLTTDRAWARITDTVDVRIEFAR